MEDGGRERQDLRTGMKTPATQCLQLDLRVDFPGIREGEPGKHGLLWLHLSFLGVPVWLSIVRKKKSRKLVVHELSHPEPVPCGCWHSWGG